MKKSLLTERWNAQHNDVDFQISSEKELDIKILRVVLLLYDCTN